MAPDGLGGKGSGISWEESVRHVAALQRINDPSWVRAEMGSISRGTLANGVANVFAGALGTLGVTPVAFTAPERLEQLRLIAELAA